MISAGLETQGQSCDESRAKDDLGYVGRKNGDDENDDGEDNGDDGIQ